MLQVWKIVLQIKWRRRNYCFLSLFAKKWISISVIPQWWQSYGGPDPLTFWQWGSKCAWTPHFFTAVLLYMACNP